jgi:formylmethanofuran dehydrogenase subunit A
MLGIVNGRVYDPANGIDGQIRDLWLQDGRIVSCGARPPGEAEILDATGLVVMPGGVDIHSHIAGPKVNAGRLLCPEDQPAALRPRTSLTRSGGGQSVPTAAVTGYRYAEMGYTTVMEAAVPPLMARHVHEELSDIPILDRGLYVLMGNNRFLLRCLRDGELEKASNYVAWLLQATKGYAIKMVSPGSALAWEDGQEISGLDDAIRGFGVTPRQIIVALADISAGLGLPHGPHLHTNRLGRTGNAITTVETLGVLDGRRAHICHLQFSSYGGGQGHPLCSAAADVARAVNAQPDLTVDIGQIVFGPATTMTADAPLEYRLHCLKGDKWLSHDVEEETKGGVVPMTYRRQNLTNATQWCIGLELLLLIENPWQVFLTTDHPNAGPFTAYGDILRLAMDRDYRALTLDSLPGGVRRRTLLAELEREYSLYEVAIITRAGPARALGLRNKGHLGAGADADVALYAPQADGAAMFSRARHVIKSGQIVVRDGALVAVPPGRTLYIAPPWDRALEPELRAYFERAYTVAWENYPVQDAYLPHAAEVPCT